MLEKNDAQPAPGAPGAASKSHVLCAGCKGAFPAGTLKKVDGELLCDMCINLKEKTRKKPKASPAPFGSSPAGLVQPESNPDVPFQPRASQKAPSVNAPMSGAMMAVIVIAVVALLGLVGFGFMMAFAK